MEKTPNLPKNPEEEKLDRMMKLIANMNINPEKAITKEDLIRLKEENRNKKDEIISKIKINLYLII